MENREYWQGVSSKSLVQRFGKHASQTQDCTVEQRAEEKRKIAEFIRVCCVEAIQQGNWPVCNALYAKVASLKRIRHSIDSNDGFGIVQWMRVESHMSTDA